MFSKFLPRTVVFFDYFEKHASILVEATQKYFEGISQPDEIPDLSQIKEFEHQADLVKQQCIESLHKTFITPIDRDQIYSLINQMDDILDELETAANDLAIFKIRTATKDFINLAEILLKSVRLVQSGVKGLRYLKDNEKNNQIHKEIHRLEHEADIVLSEAIGRLFEDEPDARQIIKWKDLYETLEDATNHCADVADILEGIFLENN